MEKLGYQDLLSKCIQNGLPGGGYSKSSSAVQGKAEPDEGTGRLVENSTTGSREDTSGAAEGLVAESDSGHRIVARMDGTAVDKLRSPFILLRKNAGAAHIRGRDLRLRDLKTDGILRSFLKSRGIVNKTPPSTFSFRSLLKGAISSSAVKPPTIVQKMAESGMRGAPKVEPQKDCVSGEKYPLLDDRRLVGERHDGVVSGRSTPQSPRDEKVFSVVGAAESWKGKGNSAPRVRDAGSISGDIVGVSGPHVSYSALLQAQLGDDVHKDSTETPQKKAGASLVDVEAHSSPLNLQLPSAELEGGFLSLLDTTTPLPPAVARRASFPASDSLSIGEQISDIHHSDKPSHASAVVESWFTDKVSGRNVSKSLRATAVPSSPVLTRVEEDASRAEVVLERGNSLTADSLCTQKETLNVQLPEGGDTALTGDELRSADILSERGAIDSSEAAVVPASAVPRRIEEHSLPAEVLGNRGRFVIADSVCIDEEMSDVQLFEELSRALAVDESQFSEKVLNRDAVDSSEASAISASAVPEKTDDDDARTVVAAERSTLDVTDSVSTYERILDIPLSEEHSGTFGAFELRSADNALNRCVIGSSVAAAVPESFVFTRIEEAYLPAGLESAGCVVDASRCGDENVSSVQLPEELSRDLALDKSWSAKAVSERDVIDSSEAAVAAISLLPLQTKEDVSRGEGVVPGLMDNGENISDLLVLDEPSHALALDGSRSAGNVFIESSEGAGDSASSAVRIITGEDIYMSEAVVENEVGHCGDVVVDTEQGKNPLRSFNASDGQVLEKRIQCPSQCLVTVKNRLEGQADRVNAGAKSDLAFQASLKKMDLTGDSKGGPEFNVCDAQIDCGVGIVSETDNAMTLGVARVILSFERDLLLQNSVVDEPVDASCDESLCSEDVRNTGTVVECSRQVALEQTEINTALLIEEQKDEMCNGHMSFPRGNVPSKSNPDLDVTKVVWERELDISKGELLHSVHSEEVLHDLNSIEKSSSTLIPFSNGRCVREEPHSTPEHSGSRSLCSRSMSESIATVAVLGSSWQAGSQPTEGINSVVGRDQEDDSCHIQVLEDFMGQDARATEEHYMSGDCGSGPQRSCVGSVEIVSNSASPHDNGNLVDVGSIHIDGIDRMISLTKDNVEQDHMLGGPEGLSEILKRSEVEEYKTRASADEAPQMQIVVSQYLESRAGNMGFFFCRSGYESEERPSSGLPLVEAGIRNETERVPESHVGEIVNGATDSGNSVDPDIQVISTDPDAVSEGLRQVCLRGSDATISDSLESAQGTGAEVVAGKEVQSPLVSKSKDRHARHLDDFEDRHARHLDDFEDSHIRHLKGLENPRTRHLDENEEQPYTSPLNGTIHDHLVGVEVHSYKKKGRPRAYNHEKSIRGTGRSHFHPSESNRKSQFQNAGNRCRRNRHIYPDQPVPVFIEGRDEVTDSKGRSPDFYLTADDYNTRETTPSCGLFSPQGFEDADGGSFLRWLAHQDEPNAAPYPALGKRVRKHGQELVKSIIAIPSFRVVSDYEEKQQEVEKRRKLGLQQQLISSSHPTFVSSSTVQPSEYDMDDEDERWLHAWNKRLARGGLKQPISEDKFEEMIEYFEKSAEMVVFVAGNVPGFSHYGKSLAQPVPGGAVPRTCPSGLGLLNTDLATSGTPVSGNSPTLNQPALRPEHPPRAGDLKGVLNTGRQAMMSSSILVDSIERNSASPASTVRLHTLISENERNISNSVVEAVCERPSEGSLRKSLESSASEKFSDDCCICNGGEDDENNPVYTCKRCLIHVHQSCYGIREKFRDDEGRVIAPSNWCCRKCEAVAVGRAQPNVSCALCRKRGGALKPTVVARKWAHVACALYTNETFFVDPDAMEPIDGIAAVAARAQERHDRCGLCGVKRGVCSLCAVKDCRAPFHISCGVSQGASFELRQSKQKVVGVRSFCPRHARTTAMDSVPSAELKDRHMLSSSSTSGATASETASGSISTASSMDAREEGSTRQSVSHPDGSFEEPAGRAENVADLADNIRSVSGMFVEDAGTVRPKGIRFTLKRRWDESCDQASEDGLSSDHQKKCDGGTGVNIGKVEAPGCKSTWHVVEPGQKLRKIKFKFGRLAQNLNSESSPTLVQQEMIGSEVPQAEKMKDVMPAVAEMRGDVDVNERDSEFVKGLSEHIFAKEVKELMILEEAMKSGVAPGHIMREAFVFWRAKRAEFKGSLLNELHHEQWLRSQRIFNKDASDEERVATGKLASPLRIPHAQQLSPMSNEKALEMVNGIRMQLERVRLMTQMVVQREKLKYNHQLVLGSIASAELIRAGGVLDEGHCVWCPSIKTLLKCGTCLRSFCFNCFKHRKGFGVKGWMAAMKQPMYICKYCRELSNELPDLSINLDPAQKKIVEGGAACTPGETSRPAIGVVSSTAVITSEAVFGVVSTSVTSSKHLGEGRGNGIANGRGKGRSWHSTGSGLLRIGEGVVMAAVSKSVDAIEDREEGLGIGRGKGNSWTASENAMRGSEDGSRNQSKPGQLEDGLNKFLSSAHSEMEHSSFETTLRRLRILGCTNTDPHLDVMTSSDEIPSGDIAPGLGMDGMEGVTPSMTIGGNFSVSSSPGSGPALLVYKKRRLILGPSSEFPPSAYDFGDQPCSSTELENGTSVYRITSPRRLSNEDGAAND